MLKALLIRKQNLFRSKFKYNPILLSSWLNDTSWLGFLRFLVSILFIISLEVKSKSSGFSSAIFLICCSTLSRSCLCLRKSKSILSFLSSSMSLRIFVDFVSTCWLLFLKWVLNSKSSPYLVSFSLLTSWSTKNIFIPQKEQQSLY